MRMTAKNIEWKFEKRAYVAEPVGEINVIHCKLLLALEMLKELGYKPEFERLSEKFIHEKSSTGS
jgi:hypothetical protein